MKFQHFKFFATQANLHLITDDFGTEHRLQDYPVSAQKALYMLNRAKVFVSGFTFEESGMRSLVDPVEEH